jgi:ribosomal protein S21
MEYAGQCSISEKPGRRGSCSSFAASSQISKNRSYGFMNMAWQKHRDDLPVVTVRNADLDFALRILKKKLDASKIMSTLKTRCRYATTADRRRAKRRISIV